MRDYILVFIGGGAGSCLRFFFNTALNNGYLKYPFGTLAANFTSCLIVGLAIPFFQSNSPIHYSLKLLVLTGVCGGFSTFSTYINELSIMQKANNYFLFSFYLIVSLLIGFLGLELGIYSSKFIKS